MQDDQIERLLKEKGQTFVDGVCFGIIEGLKIANMEGEK